MAKYQAIAAISNAILKLLENAWRADENPAGIDPTFELYHKPGDFRTPIPEGITLYLYRISTSSRRNLPPRPGRELYRPPLPIDLYYLLTAWGRTAVFQQQLLGWSLRELNDNPNLPASLLNGYWGEGDEEVFPENEDVTLTFEPLSLQELANLFEPLKPNLQPSATYVARMVAIDSRIRLTESAPVQTRQFDFLRRADR